MFLYNPRPIGECNMPPIETGKSGTITKEEFDTLSGFVGTYGSKLMSQKVAKVCTRLGTKFKHEFANSPVANAWLGLATKINNATGTGNRPITGAAYTFLTGLVGMYGAEVVVQKIAKIGLKNGGNTAEANAMKALFPKAA
jgi:hypothetical protein